MPHPTVADVVALLERRYPPQLAESWDAVGLTCGDPAATVRRVLFAVDPDPVVADEAVGSGTDLLVTHHPLFLRPVHSVAATDAKGRVVQRLLEHGCALFSAHTNADSARPGVSDALADALGVVDAEPLQALPGDPVDKVVVFVPHADVERVLAAMAAAGAGGIGAYEDCAYVLEGTGRFRPRAGARPHVGEVGRLETVAEQRVEMVVPRSRRWAVVDALLAAHPYEEPAYDVYERALPPSDRGLGRVGDLPQEVLLGEFAATVATALPATSHGVRVAGDPDRTVRRVAVCGGAGDSLMGAADAAGADVFVTADLRHHRAQEHLADGGCALVDVAHWASEWPWLDRAAAALVEDLAGSGTTVETRVSTRVTDPWSLHLRSPR
ncbi:MAG: Nif3-like dinuclear metal center hexameric protein [Candidatus Nanopelagicales bacterium]